ncbi:MAG: ATP-grasp domain-containing protein [Gemmatimonadetes bacterium]|nr:ATP-grasp domain-containing protein [Gemmatimonadota bacterium]
MKNVVFVAPYFAETTLRFVSAATRQRDARVALVSQDPVDRLPADLRARLAGHERLQAGLDPDQIASAVERAVQAWGHVDRLLGTLEELQTPLGRIRDTLGVPGMGEEAAENFRDKPRMKEILRNAGVPCARHGLARSAKEARDLAGHVGFPLIVKPPAGSGARGTFRIEGPDELEQLVAALPPGPERPALLEEFIVGTEHSFDSVCLGGEMVWHSINDYLPTPLEVLREPWIQWCVLLPRETEDAAYQGIRAAAQSALSALGMDTGMSHMEWFQRPDGSVAVSEVGARPPGARFVNLISWAHDFDLFDAWARVVIHGEFTPRPRPYAAGAVYLRGQGSGRRVERIRGAELIDALKDLVVEARLPQTGQVASGTYEGEGYVILRHPDTEVVKKGLAQLLRGIRVELGD